MKVPSIFKRKKRSKKAKNEGGGSGGVTDDENQPTTSMTPEPGDGEFEDEEDRTGDDYYSDMSRGSPNPPSINGDSPRDSPSPIPASPSPSPYRPPSPSPSTSHSLSPSPSPSPERAVHSSQKATLALLASLAAGVARERRVSFELPHGRNIIPDAYHSSPNLRASSPLVYPSGSSTPPSALRSSLNYSAPSPVPSTTTNDAPQSPPPPSQALPSSQMPPAQPPLSPTPTQEHSEPQDLPSEPSPEPYVVGSDGEFEEGGEGEYEDAGEDEEVEEYEDDEEEEEDEAAIFLAMREKRRRGRPLSNLERRIEVIEARERWLGEQEVLLKEESERLEDLNINLNMEVQAVERQKRAAQRAEKSARTRVRKAEEVLHLKEKAIDIVKEGLQEDKRVIQMKRDILLVQRSQLTTGRRTTPYKFPKLLPSRKVNGLVCDDLSFNGSGVSSLPWKRQPPPSLIASYAPAASIPRGTTPSVSPPPRNSTPKSSRSPVNRAGAATPGGTPIVTIDLSSFAETGSNRSYSPASSRHSSTPPISYNSSRKHRASYPVSPFPNMYLYEQEGENDFADIEEGPMTLRLHSGDEDENYLNPEEQDLDAELVGPEEEGEIGDENGGEVPAEEAEPVQEEAISSPEPIPTSPPHAKTSKGRKKQSNLMQQLQLHMSPHQQQRFQANAAAQQVPQTQTRIPTTPTTSDIPTTPLPVASPAPTPTPTNTPQRKPSPPKKVPSDDVSRSSEDKAKRSDALAKPPDRKPPPPPPQGESVPAITVSPSVPAPSSSGATRLQNTPSTGSVSRQTAPQSQSPQPPPPQQPPQPPQGYQQPYQPYPNPYQPYQPPYQQYPQPQPYQPQQFQPYPYQPIFSPQPQPQQPQQPQPHPHPPQYQQQHQARSISPSKQQSLTNSNSTSFSSSPQKQTTKQNSSSSITNTPALNSTPNGNPQLSPKPSTNTNISTSAPNSPSTNKRSLSPQKQTPPPQTTSAHTPTHSPIHIASPPSPTSPKKQLPIHPHEVHIPSPPLQMLPEISLLSDPLPSDSEQFQSISVISLSNEKFKAGFLNRREGTGMAVNWPRKYIVMTKSGLLYYFRSAVDFTTSGYTDLNNFTHIKIPEDPKNRHNYPKFTFQLVRKKSTPPSPNANSTPTTKNKVLLSADSKKEMLAWMGAISAFWEMEAEKNQKKVTIMAPSPVPTATVTVVRTPSPPVKVVPPPPEVKPVEAVQSGGVSVEPLQKKRSGKGRKFVS